MDEQRPEQPKQVNLSSGMSLQPYVSEQGILICQLEAYLSSALVPLTCILMTLHGGNLQKKGVQYLFHFPAGTREHEILPRIHDSRFYIVFPDGFKLYEATWQGEHEVCLFKSDVPEDLPTFVRQLPGYEDVTHIAEFKHVHDFTWQEKSYQIQEGELWPVHLPSPASSEEITVNLVNRASVTIPSHLVSLTPIIQLVRKKGVVFLIDSL